MGVTLEAYVLQLGAGTIKQARGQLPLQDAVQWFSAWDVQRVSSVTRVTRNTEQPVFTEFT